MLQETPPSAVLHALEQQDGACSPLLLCTTTDLTLQGQFARQWLVVTERALAVLSDQPAPTVLVSLRLDGIETIRAHAALGSGFLQARLDGAWIDLLRYSNSLAYRFGKVAGKLETLRAGGEFDVRPEDDVDDCRCSTCGLVLSFAGDVCPRCINRGAVIGRIWRFMRPYRVPAILMCALLLVSVVVELAPPKLQQYLVDHILRIEQPDRSANELLTALVAIVAGLAGTRFILAVANAFKGAIANRVGTALTSDLRGQLVDKLQRLSVDYYDRHPVGVLMSRVAHDTEALYGLIHQFTGGFLMQILQLVGVGVMLFTINAKLALWTLIPMPFVLYGSWFFWRYVYPKYYRYWDSTSKQAGALAGMLAGIRVVKAFAQERREFDRFQATSDSLRRSRLAVETSSSTFSAIMQLLFSLGGLIVWFVGGRDVLHGAMTLGSLMAFLAYLTMFYTPLSTLAQLTTWLTSFLTASHRVFELLDTPVGVREVTQPVRLHGARGEIRFDNVTFGYDRHHPVLKDFNLTIHPGEMIGIVGRSGSGKTTLVNLISRYYDVDAGRVAIDGQDVRQIAREDLCAQVGVVLQEPFLFRGTVWENLVYGRPHATPEEALAAAKGANAHDFILRLPLGYETWLGERGAGLSGGEKQRLSIARTLLYNPQILILDEATSSVDTESEKSIQDALAVLTRGRTTIAIAHRLSTLRNADRILVMNHGKLVEQGSHAELMKQDGLYAKLVRIQTDLAAEPTVNGLVMASVERTEAQQLGDSSRHAGKRNRGGATAGNEPSDWREAEEVAAAQFAPRWLQPKTTGLSRGEYNTLSVRVADELYSGVFAVRALPAMFVDGYISLRYADADGQDHEIGMLRSLADWPAEMQALIRDALERRYFVRRIESVESIEQEYGYLSFRVDTDRGPAMFVMRASQSQVQDYGKAGKILTDVDDNRYVVEDIEALPARQQLLFRRYIYW
jgi:ATP-binding cassette, subfamily B, bacterial